MGKEESEKNWKIKEDLRNKDWINCSVEEKLDKLRYAIQELPNWQRKINDIQRILRKLEKHTHDQNGKLLVEFDRYDDGSDTVLGYMIRSMID